MMNSFLKKIKKVAWKLDSVPRSDGRFLEAYVKKTKRRHALEIGSGNGYSTIWIGMGMKTNRGKLHTIEISPSRARQCRENIRSAGLEGTVICIEGDALDETAGMNDCFDFLLLDLGPVDMLPVLKAAEPKLTADAIIILHNTGFAYAYRRLFEYATSKGWVLDKAHSEDGKGFGFPG